jgi:hypothetical protein
MGYSGCGYSRKCSMYARPENTVLKSFHYTQKLQTKDLITTEECFSDVIKLMAHKMKETKWTSHYSTYLLHWTLTVPHIPSAVLHNPYLVNRPGFSVGLIFLCTMFTLLTAFLTMFPLEGLAFVLGKTSSLCVEDRVRIIFFPLTRIKILQQITT